MIREIINRAYNGTLNYVELVGLSTDTKPTSNLVTGSRFVEVDTGDVYLFNETNNTWNKIISGPVVETSGT